MAFDQNVIEALALLRTYAARTGSTMTNRSRKAFNTLDNAGVFAALDEQTDYASAEDILAESAIRAINNELGALDPAEWGDTTRADQFARQTCTCPDGPFVDVSPALHAGTCPVWALHHNLA